MEQYYHSVRLQNDLCKGCTNCIKSCPTEAIRVRKSKARIIPERCIDCGECIRICPHKAKKAVTDDLASLNNFKYTIAIPAPTLYSQFSETHSKNKILIALKKLGFDEIYEVARGAEFVTLATREYLKQKDIERPVISSACPAVVRLIQVRFPNLIPNILKMQSPMEVAAKIARQEFVKKNNVEAKDIGVFFISPCAAKMTSVKSSYENEISNVDGVLALNTVYFEMLKNFKNISDADELKYDSASYIGIRWANSGGESLASGTDKFLAVDGINNVSKILEEVEGDRLRDIEFIEALACEGGCLGGPLTVENLYVAKARMKKIVEDDPIREIASPKYDVGDLKWGKELYHVDIMKLDEDINIAMEKMTMMKDIEQQLPGLDCGACGSPSCKSLAEDVTRDFANITDCVFVLRQKVSKLASEMIELESKLPPVLDKDKDA